jgi:hypothetical protein
MRKTKQPSKAAKPVSGFSNTRFADKDPDKLAQRRGDATTGSMSREPTKRAKKAPT